MAIWQQVDRPIVVSTCPSDHQKQSVREPVSVTRETGQHVSTRYLAKSTVMG